VPVPILGVIEPPAQTAVRLTRNRRIGIIGTEATIASCQYDEAVRRWARRPVMVFGRACPDFVELAERGETVGDGVLATAERYLAPMKEAEVDTLILGCTHYPLLSGAIQYVMGPDVLLVSSAEETAKDVYTVLVAGGLLRTESASPVYEFLASGPPEDFLRLGHRFLGPEITAVATHPLA
jgi:glutamate racemase